MSGRRHRPRPNVKLDARDCETLDKAADEAEDIEECDPRLEEAKAAWFALLDADDASYEHHTAIARAGSKVWAIRAELLVDAGEHDAARKAASTSNELSQLAVKLDMSAVVDRVTKMENLLRQARGDATKLATLK
jgi:hypothetical protein